MDIILNLHHFREKRRAFVCVCVCTIWFLVFLSQVFPNMVCHKCLIFSCFCLSKTPGHLSFPRNFDFQSHAEKAGEIEFAFNIYTDIKYTVNSAWGALYSK